MTNEIKEIIEYLKDDSMFIYDEDGTRKEITLDESKLLLDYITNLQEENERLKELADKYEEEHKTTYETWKKDIIANKKAIEYIEHNWIDYETAKDIKEYDELNIPIQDIKDLYDILRGEE